MGTVGRRGKRVTGGAAKSWSLTKGRNRSAGERAVVGGTADRRVGVTYGGGAIKDRGEEAW